MSFVEELERLVSAPRELPADLTESLGTIFRAEPVSPASRSILHGFKEALDEAMSEDARVNPDQYHHQHGKCPPGWHWDGNKCTKSDQAGGGQPKSAPAPAAKAPEKPGPADKYNPKKNADYKKKLTSTVNTLAKAIEQGGVKNDQGELIPFRSKKSLSEHIKIAKQVLGKHEAGLSKAIDGIKGVVPAGVEVKVKGRTKALESALGKLVRKPKNYSDVSDLQDVTGMRVIAHGIDDVKKTVEAIKKKYKVISEDDYINQPNGDYRSWHLIIQDHDGLPKEVQVRTQNQNTFADWAHNVYKPRNDAQLAALAKDKKSIDDYSKAMSQHFYDEDTGKSVGKPPPCPEIVQHAFGCLS